MHFCGRGQEATGSSFQASTQCCARALAGSPPPSAPSYPIYGVHEAGTDTLSSGTGGSPQHQSQLLAQRQQRRQDSSPCILTAAVQLMDDTHSHHTPAHLRRKWSKVGQVDTRFLYKSLMLAFSSTTLRVRASVRSRDHTFVNVLVQTGPCAAHMRTHAHPNSRSHPHTTMRGTTQIRERLGRIQTAGEQNKCRQASLRAHMPSLSASSSSASLAAVAACPPAPVHSPPPHHTDSSTSSRHSCKEVLDLGSHRDAHSPHVHGQSLSSTSSASLPVPPPRPIRRSIDMHETGAAAVARAPVGCSHWAPQVREVGMEVGGGEQERG